ncbi:succinylglutamate desuccinylase/aspartoacylase family protein [Oligoflexia bacterium]|nr:succinylglutamate desuccinylase/aspartoacylase family protein [Oligoflexia bacterium]
MYLDQSPNTNLEAAAFTESPTPRAPVGPAADDERPDLVGCDVDQLFAEIAQSCSRTSYSRTASNISITRLPISSAWLIDSGKPGPRFSVFAGIHGDEISGIYAVFDLMRSFGSGELTLTHGSLQLAIGNEEAVSANERCLDANLNRLFGKINRERVAAELNEFENPTDLPEFQRAEALESILRKAQRHVCLHSTSAPTDSFGVCTERSLEMAKQMGSGKVVLIPPQILEENFGGGSSIFFETLNPDNLGSTCESGQHTDAFAPLRAKQRVLELMALTGIIDYPLPPTDSKPEVYRLIHVVSRTKAGIAEGNRFKFQRDPQNFDRYTATEIIGHVGQQAFRLSDFCDHPHAYLVFPAKKDPLRKDDIFSLAELLS